LADASVLQIEPGHVIGNPQVTWAPGAAVAPVDYSLATTALLHLAGDVDGTNAALLSALGRRVDELQSEVDHLHNRLHEMFACLEVRVMCGYLVKIWPDAEVGEWVAECPKVGVGVQEPSRDEAVQAIGSMVEKVLQLKRDFGDELPAEDL
jgi:hypothetical protein